jgi:hypothetical protein
MLSGVFIVDAGEVAFLFSDAVEESSENLGQLLCNRTTQFIRD